jgi:hypothetical protein
VRTLAPAAVLQVRRWGGILEHPARSLLWDVMRLPRPIPAGGLAGLSERDSFGGFTLEVELGWWGSTMRKPTWLYMVGVRLSDALRALPSPSEPAPVPAVYRTGSRDAGRTWKRSGYDLAGPTERKRTPPAMAAWLADLAASAGHPAENPRRQM